MKVKTKPQLKDLLKRTEENISSLAHVIRNITTIDFDEVSKVLAIADSIRIEIKESVN